MQVLVQLQLVVHVLLLLLLLAPELVVAVVLAPPALHILAWVATVDLATPV
jgi:hypothetical protein